MLARTTINAEKNKGTVLKLGDQRGLRGLERLNGRPIGRLIAV